MRILRIISRVVVGVTFVFSGFVKGVDPMGTMYKIQDYFIAYNMDWALPTAIFFSFLLVTLEFALGIYLLLNLRIKLASRILLVMMSFFTVVTLFDALYNPVADCGCFGEAIKLTNWETFYKNLVLMVFTLIVVFTPRHKKVTMSLKRQDTVGLLFIIAFALFSFYSYKNLPPLDFRDWKEGKNMKQQGEEKYYLIYKNVNSGETKKYLSSKIPYNDTTWTNNWEFVKQKIDYSEVKRKHNLQIIDFNGNDVTQSIIENPEYQFVVSAYSFDEASLRGLQQIVQLYKALDDKGYQFALLTSALKNRVEEFYKRYDTSIPVYQADDIELKSIIRSNPGLILLKNGIVLEKWHYSNIPGNKEILNQYPLKQ